MLTISDLAFWRTRNRVFYYQVGNIYFAAVARDEFGEGVYKVSEYLLRNKIHTNLIHVLNAKNNTIPFDTLMLKRLNLPYGTLLICGHGVYS